MLGLNLIKYSQVNSSPPPFADLIWWNYEHWQKLSSDVEICNGSKNTGMIFAKFYFQLISLKYFFFNSEIFLSLFFVPETIINIWNHPWENNVKTNTKQLFIVLFLSIALHAFYW